MHQSPRYFNPLCILHDNCEGGDTAVPLTVIAGTSWLAIRPHGYGEREAIDGYGEPILMEVWKGELRLLVGTDINDSDKSVISLEGAREDRRREKRPTESSPPPLLPENREHPWRTVAMQVTGPGAAGALALQLITHSLWFRCTPLPNDEFEFAVKVEHTDRLMCSAMDC